MAGRRPREALAAFIDPLQRALSCVSRANLLYRPPWPPRVQALGVSEEPIRLKAKDGGPAPSLYLEQQYQVIEAPDERGPWKVSTRAYRYRVDSAAGEELVLWHWHPTDQEGRPHKEPRPHLHAQVGDLRGLHLLTGRVGVESIIRVLINEFGVQPRRDDWQSTLDTTEALFEQWRTWP